MTDIAFYAVVRRVPRGRVVTYGQVAALSGKPRNARAVGRALRECPDDVPWHRVVNSQGRVSRRRGGSAGGDARKGREAMLSQRRLLEREGVRFEGGRIDLRRFRWQAGFRADLLGER